MLEPFLTSTELDARGSCRAYTSLVVCVMTRNRSIGYLVLILFAGFGLRIWGIWFGLPFGFAVDEYHEVFRALELGTGRFNFERTGKGGLFYILFVEYGILFVTLKIAGVISSANDFARYFVEDPTIFYLLGRATTVVFGTLNIFLVYRLGVRAYSTGAGIIAAAFLAVDFLNVEHSHYITVDVPMTCLATAALLFAVRMVSEGRAHDYKWAALFAALATTTKLPAILVIVPLLVAHVAYVKQAGGRSTDLLSSRNLWWAVSIFVVTLVITNPGYLVNPPLLGAFDLGESGDGVDFEIEQEESDLPAAPNLFWFYITALAHSMGWPLLIVSFAGAIYALRKHTVADLMLLSFALVFYVALSSTSSQLYYPRYLLPVVVVLVLLAGRLLRDFWPRQGIFKQAIAVTAVVALAATPAYKSAANSHSFTKPDTRAAAKEWFEAQIPIGAQVLIEGLKIEPTRLTVPLQDTEENLRAYAEQYRVSEPGKTKYLDFKLQVMTGPTYDLKLIKPADLGRFDLKHFKDAGIQYLVIRPDALARSRKVGPAGLVLLEELKNDPDVSLIKSFLATSGALRGPTIEIYRIDPNVSSPVAK